MIETEQLKIWTSQLGRDWTDQNIIDYRTRIPAFREMISSLDVRKILEVGCGRGHNLAALSEIGDYDLLGVEPLRYAISPNGKASFLAADCFHIPFADSCFDLVFTCSVLGHVAGEDLPKAIEEMCRVTSRFLLLIEYYAKQEASVRWRGHDNLLWKRNYKDFLYYQKPDLKCTAEGLLEQIDNSNWWLFSKH